MIYLLLYASLSSGIVATSANQRRVDDLVRRCAATKVVRLLVHGNDVSLHPLILTRPPTSAENKRFECVMRGMEKMPKLHVGFIGNEAEPNVR